MIRAVCCPPPEVLQGKAGRARRLVPRADASPRWWDVEFFPLHDQAGLLCVLGKIRPLPTHPMDSHPPLPENLVALRQRAAERYTFDQLASSLPAFQRVVEQVRLASQSDVPVLILGEPGTGKRWVARTIHHQGTMREGTFAAIDCARLPPLLLSAYLLGHSSPSRNAGRATMYLAEPALLPRDLQMQLCAHLSEAQQQPARIIAGCNSNPQEEIRAGRLAEEFYCALSTLVISLPPLRARQVDLSSLVERFLERIDSGSERPVSGLTAGAWDLLGSYAWPGNLSELYAVLRSACQRTTTDSIDASDLPAKLRLAVRLEKSPQPEPERPLRLDHVLEQAERRLIRAALRKTQGNRSRAAELLSIWRPRLLRRMEALRITEW